MTTLIALLHIAGATIAVLGFGIGVLALGAWESERNRKAATEEMSIALGIPVGRLDSPENARKVLRYAAERCSSEKLQNRLSDLCWWVQSAWNWLGWLIQVGIVLGVLWLTVTEDASNAVYIWWTLGVAFFFWIVSVAFAFGCKLLTGRFPGQARQGRKGLAEFMKTQEAETALGH